MQKLIALGVTAGVLFALSAGTSFYLRHSDPNLAELPAVKQGVPRKPALGALLPPTDSASEKSPAVSSSLKPAVRPPYNPEADSAVQLAANLNKQTEALRANEQALNARKKSIELACQDVRNERTVIDELRKKLGQELSALEARLAMLEQQSGELDQKQQKTTRQMEDLKKSVVEFDGQEQDRIKHLAAVYDAMAPASAAKILQQMADGGGLETAVKILSLMKDRQAAKVLAELPNSNVAAQLMDKLKGLKKPSLPEKK